MLNKNFAATSAMIGRAPNMVIEQPHFTKQEDWGQIMSKFLTDYKNQENEKALVAAMEGGDPQAIDVAFAKYNPQAAMQQRLSQMAEQRQFERQKELANINNAAALERIKQTYAARGGAGGFGNTEAGLALRIIANPEQYDPQMVEWAGNKLASNSGASVYDMAYQKKRGAKQAEQEAEQAKQNLIAQDQNSSIDSLIGDIEANRELVGVYSPIRASLGRLSGGKIGYSADELTKRGNLIRQVGNIQNDIIAKARAAGQTGINTIAEIQQATKGLNENSSDAELIGALRAMQKSNNALAARMASKPNVGISNNVDPLGLR